MCVNILTVQIYIKTLSPVIVFSNLYVEWYKYSYHLILFVINFVWSSKLRVYLGCSHTCSILQLHYLCVQYIIQRRPSIHSNPLSETDTFKVEEVTIFIMKIITIIFLNKKLCVTDHEWHIPTRDTWKVYDKVCYEVLNHCTLIIMEVQKSILLLNLTDLFDRSSLSIFPNWY